MKKIIYLFFFLCSFSYACSDDAVTPEDGGGSTSKPIQASLRDGITVLSDDSLAFVLYAPKKQTVHLIGDFNDWKATDANKMNKDGDRFWIKIGNLTKNKEYICQYLIDDKIRVADPYASKIADPDNDKYIPSTIYPNLITYPAGKTTNIAMTVSTNRTQYPWKVNNFNFTQKDNMVIYEVLIRDFTEERSIKGVQSQLSYLKNLGVNAIELMPFNEFEGNDSWGYNPSFYFATDKAYGTPNDYKDFIDECHANGIAVIMDMVLNHSYGQSPMVQMYLGADGKVSADNPWYNVNSPNTAYSWGYDFNHESKPTQQLVDSICSYWMKEYKLDGFRFDFTKGFTNKGGDGWAYDASRINILKRMTNEIKKRNPNALVILEHLTDNSEEKELAEAGMHLWGNMNYSFNEATMGWGAELDNGKPKGDISWASYKQRGWTEPNLIAYMESHDEERIMFKNNTYGNDKMLPYNVKNLATGLKRTEAAAVILMTFPGPKMIWQFGELGYDYKLGANMEDGRLEKKPIRWDYYDVKERKSLYDVYAKMNKLRTSNPIFGTMDYTMQVEGVYKQILLKSATGNVCAIANLGMTTKSAVVSFEKTGIWEDDFTGTTLNVTSATMPVELQPGEYRLYISK